MSVQFDTFDTLEDRRELVILFQRLGEGPRADALRAKWLESLIPKTWQVPSVNPASCHPVGAYYLFVQIVGVLGVPIRVAAAALDEYVASGSWHET